MESYQRDLSTAWNHEEHEGIEGLQIWFVALQPCAAPLHAVEDWTTDYTDFTDWMPVAPIQNIRVIREIRG